jgi:predicted ATP-grasp superfamily ATP-dependent carboligase
LKARAKILLATLNPQWVAPLHLPYLLRHADVEVHLLAPKGRAPASRFVHVLPEDPADEPGFVRSLRDRLAARADEYRLILLGDDDAFAALAMDKDRAWLSTWFPVDPFGENLEALYLKHCFNELCHRHGLRAPKNVACRDLAEALAAAETLGYPVMLKNHLGSGGLGVRQAGDRAALASHYAALSAASPHGLSVQEYIPGILGDCHVVARHGKVRQWFCYETRKTWPAPESPPTVTATVKSPEADELAFRVTEITGFHGIFGLDWVRSDRDGHTYLLECNPRMTPALCRGTLFGLDIADAIAELWQEPAPAYPPRTIRRQGIERSFPRDFLRCLDEGDWRGLWLNARDTLLGRNYIAWSDPGLVYPAFRMIAVHFLQVRTGLWPWLQAIRRRLRPARTCF